MSAGHDVRGFFGGYVLVFQSHKDLQQHKFVDAVIVAAGNANSFAVVEGVIN